MDFYIILIIIVIASLIKGITGFGFAMVALPPLLFYYSPVDIIPVLVMCNLFASFIMILQKRDYPRLGKKINQMIIYGTIFAIFGALILKNVPGTTLKFILGILFIAMTIISLIRPKHIRQYSLTSYKIIGGIIGLLTSSISVSGPPLVLFLQTTNIDNKQFRITFAWFNVFTASIAVAGYAIAGFIHKNTLLMVLYFVPILYLGSYIGKRLNAYLPEKLFHTLILMITFVASLMLLMP